MLILASGGEIEGGRVREKKGRGREREAREKGREGEGERGKERGVRVND